MAQGIVTYEITAPNGEVYEVDAPASATEAEVLAYAQRQFAAASQQEPSQLEQLTRATGLAARDNIMGVAGLPLMFGDALNAGIDYGIEGINKLTGSSFPKLGSPSATLEAGLDRAGLPRPANRTEDTLSSLTRVLSSAGGTKAGADLLAKVAPPATQAGQTLVNLFRSNPGAQLAPGAASVFATDAARNSFDVQDPFALGMIGMTAGLGTGATTTVGKEVGRGIVQPFTRQGREAIVGQTLRRLSTNPEGAMINLGNSAETIPGVRSTTAATARDPGIAGAETPIRALDNTNQFGLRITQNNAARMRELDRISGDPAKIAAAEAKRARITAPMREEAFRNQVVSDAAFQAGIAGNVYRTIDDILASPIGKRADVQQALTWAKSRIEQAKTPRELYEIRKDIAGAMQGKYNADMPNIRLAKGQLTDVVRSIDNTLEAAVPGFKEYMQKFAKMSQPIDQMNLLQDIRNKVTRGQTDILNNQPVITASALRNQLAARAEEIGATLSPAQQKVLDKIIKDIDRGMSATAPGIKPPGSDTFRNMSTANLIGRVFSENMADNTTLRTMTRPLDWLFKLPDEAVKNLLVEAMLDPKLSSQLMAKASIVRVQPVSEQLRQKAIAMGYGAAIGADK